VAVTRDRTTYTNVPEMYIDGAAQVVTEVVPPNAYVPGEEGTTLEIGNLHNLYMAYPFEGYIKNVRIYNVVLTPAEVADLAAGVNITRGLVFYGPNVKTKNLTYFDNKLLDENNDGLIDDMYGAIGYAIGTVTSQLIPYP